MQEGQDSEPLFGDDIYNLLRNDSLLNRTGSLNFASLVDTSESPLTLDQTQLQLPDDPQQHVQQEQLQQQQLAYQQPITNQTLLIQDGSCGLMYPMVIAEEQQQQQQQQQQQEKQPQPQPEHQTPRQEHHRQQPERESTSWSTIGLNPEVIAPSQVIQQEHLSSLHESSTSYLPDSTPSHTVPSLQPWPGRYSFSLSLPIDNKDRNKWCYSQQQDKLYLCPNVAVPVNVMLSEWIDGSLTITPVFKDSRFRMEPVTRCYNCKSKQSSDIAEHIVQIQGNGCDYNMVHERCVVTVPLEPPPPGEVSSTLLLKLMCLTSCVGGPNRRPFCLVFTLRDSTGIEIGRQILDTKCCKCPSRDMTNEDKVSNTRVNTATLTPDAENEAEMQIITTEIKVGQKRKRPNNIKVEPGTNPRFVSIDVPVEFESKVKHFVNCLIAEKIIKHNHPDLLRFPDE